MAVTTDATVAEMQEAMAAMRANIEGLDRRHQRLADAVTNHESVIHEGFRAHMITQNEVIESARTQLQVLDQNMEGIMMRLERLEMRNSETDTGTLPTAQTTTTTPPFQTTSATPPGPEPGAWSEELRMVQERVELVLMRVEDLTSNAFLDKLEAVKVELFEHEDVQKVVQGYWDERVQEIEERIQASGESRQVLQEKIIELQAVIERVGDEMDGVPE